MIAALLFVSIPAALRADMAPDYKPRGKAARSLELIAACRDGDVEEARSLLKRGASPTWEKPDQYQTSAFDSENGPAFIIAIREKKIDVLRLLLDERPQLIKTHGAKMLDEILGGPASYHEPATDLQFLKLLIERKVDVNRPDPDDGRTPLIEAARRGKSEAVRTLIAAGADASRKSKDGKTALAHARATTPPAKEHAEIIKLLEPITK